MDTPTSNLIGIAVAALAPQLLFVGGLVVFVAGCDHAPETTLVLEEELILTTVMGEEEEYASNALFHAGPGGPIDQPTLHRTCEPSAGYWALFDHYDANGDGTLDGGERESAWAARAARSECEIRRREQVWATLTAIYDSNGDHALEADETKALFVQFDTRCQLGWVRVRTEFDLDANSMVSDDELDVFRDEVAAYRAARETMCPNADVTPDDSILGQAQQTMEGSWTLPPTAARWDTNGDGSLQPHERMAAQADIRSGRLLVDPTYR